jgi:flap endonuclease-1
MGIKNLMKLIKRHSPASVSSINISNLDGKKVAVDANLFIYKSVFALRGGLGKDMEYDVNGKKKKVTHLYIMFIRLYGMLKKGMKPIFVFDYAFPEIKGKCIQERKEKRAEYKKLYMTSKDEKMKKKYYSICEDINRTEYQDIMNLLELFGIPYIMAPEEADSQCAHMINAGLVDYVITDDMDLLMFGCGKIIKNFTTSDSKKMQLIDLKKVLSGLKMTMNSFIQLGILLGSDYADTVKGIGYVKAYDIIKKHTSIFVAKLYKDIPKDYKYEKAYSYFLSGKHQKVDPDVVNIKKINVSKLKSFMNTNGFNKNKTIKSYLAKLNQ